MKGKFQIRIILRQVFGFTKHQQKATYGLENKLTLTGNGNAVVLKKTPKLADVKKVVSSIDWYVPQYTTSNAQQGLLSKQILSKAPIELQYIGRSVFFGRCKQSKLMDF